MGGIATPRYARFAMTIEWAEGSWVVGDRHAALRKEKDLTTMHCIVVSTMTYWIVWRYGLM